MSEAETVGGRYVLDGRLGEGGMGCVYRARHLQLGKPFALKIISTAFADDSAARARFNQEAKLASEISHPNIVTVVDYGEDAQLGAYMVMELVDGEPLIAPGTLPMTVRRACDVLGQIADALDHIHRRGIVHGDVKADNIMLAADTAGARRRQIVRLLDFGLARRHDASHDDNTVSGSPHYLAPERAGGAAASVATDIYALGVLGYLLLTGTLPFDGTVVEILTAHVHTRPESPAVRRSDSLDPALEALVLRALEKDPGARHASAAAFRYELNTVMQMLDIARRRKSAPMRTESPREATIVEVFERSRIPQAVMSADGVIAFANKAFLKLLGRTEPVDGEHVTETLLASVVPGLVRAIREAYNGKKPVERRAQVHRGSDKPLLELVLWFCPLPMTGNEVHLMVRVEER